MSIKGVIFAGGGTGGHIFPAIAIDEKLNRASATDQSSGQCSSEQPPPAPSAHRTNLPTAFLCSTRAIDRSILEPRSLDFTPIPATPFSSRPFALARFFLAWPHAVSACRDAILTRCTGWNIEPAHCALVATGGFVCAPAAAAARKLGCPVYLVNLDAVPGKAARLLARRADDIFTTYPAFNRNPIGPIVRAQARAPADAQTCRALLNLEPHKPTLVVSGASQGASSINAFIPELVRQHPDWFQGWQILHQGGADRVDRVRDAYRDLPVPTTVVGLINEVGLMWGAATLAVTRAGAGTVAELMVNRVPALLMPYPYHRDQHQKLNARPLVEAGMATVLTDQIDPRENLETHAETFAKALEQAQNNQNLARIPIPDDGAAQIAESIRNK